MSVTTGAVEALQGGGCARAEGSCPTARAPSRRLSTPPDDVLSLDVSGLRGIVEYARPS
jgi:hypothetical protein